MRELPAHGRVQVPRCVQRAGRSSRRSSARAASSRSRPATMRRPSRSSARLLGMPATIVMPQDAPAIKIEATRGYGAEVLLYDRYTEDREAISQRLARERGMTLIPPVRPSARHGGAGYGRARTDAGRRAARPAAGLRRRRRTDLGLRHGGYATCSRTAASSASSPRPATTCSSRCAGARSCTSTCRTRSPTARRPSTLAATRSR